MEIPLLDRHFLNRPTTASDLAKGIVYGSCGDIIAHKGRAPPMRLITLVYRTSRVADSLGADRYRHGRGRGRGGGVGGIADGFKRSFLDMYQSHGVDVVVVRGRSADRMTSELDQTIGEKIKALPNVDGRRGGVAGRRIAGGAWARGRRRPRATADERLVASGSSRPAAGSLSRISAWPFLGRILAANLGKTVGDEIEIYENDASALSAFMTAATSSTTAR